MTSTLASLLFLSAKLIFSPAPVSFGAMNPCMNRPLPCIAKDVKCAIYWERNFKQQEAACWGGLKQCLTNKSYPATQALYKNLKNCLNKAAKKTCPSLITCTLLKASKNIDKYKACVNHCIKSSSKRCHNTYSLRAFCSTRKGVCITTAKQVYSQNVKKCSKVGLRLCGYIQKRMSPASRYDKQCKGYWHCYACIPK